MKRKRIQFLSTSALCISAIFAVASTAHAAFDPYEGSENPTTESRPARVTSVRQRPSTIAFPATAPAPAPVPQIAFAPLTPAPAVAPIDAPAMAAVEPAAAAPEFPRIHFDPLPAKTAALPPVDPAVVARAQQEMAASGPSPAPAIVPVVAAPIVPPAVVETPAFQAPRPLIAPVPVVTPPPSSVASTQTVTPLAPISAPVVSTPAPTSVAGGRTAVAAVPVVAAPASVAPVKVVPVENQGTALTRDTKTIVGTIPSRIDTPKNEKTTKVTLNRTGAKPLEAQEGKVEAYEATGIKISVRRPGLDTNYELNRAFTAMSGGDTETAIKTYQDVLSAEPNNQDALFGLAAIYHRNGELDRARPLYGQLLKVNPNHREGINNFMALMSEESPQESLAELERLEQRNPDFSPIPAQQALVLNKLGYTQEARNKMMRAIELAPENLTYKYNLAIMLDKPGTQDQAAALYRLLLDANSRGAALPAPADTIQKRLNYIATAMTAAKPQIMQN